MRRESLPEREDGRRGDPPFERESEPLTLKDRRAYPFLDVSHIQEGVNAVRAYYAEHPTAFGNVDTAVALLLLEQAEREERLVSLYHDELVKAGAA